jgi:hypothetical protein
MNEQERAFIGVAWAIAYAIVWFALLILLFRYGVAALWGSGNDLGLVAAPVLAAAGVVGLSYLAVIMVRDLRKKF